MPTPQNLSFESRKEAVLKERERATRAREREAAQQQRWADEYAKRKEAGLIKPRKAKEKVAGEYYWDTAHQKYVRYSEEEAQADAMRKKPTKKRKRRAKRVQWVAETYWNCKAKAYLPKRKGQKYYDEKTKKYVTYLGPLRVEIEPPPKVEEVKKVKVKAVKVAEPPTVKEDTYYDIRYRKHIPKKRGRKYYDEQTKQYVVYTGPKPEIQHYDFSNDHTWDGQHYEL